MRWALVVATIAISSWAIACAFVPRAASPTSIAAPAEPLDPPTDPPLAVVTSDPLACVTGLSLPPVANVFEAAWSADSAKIAVSHLVTIPNPRTITGVEEDQRLAIIDVASGSVREIGPGSEPVWSGSGKYLAFSAPGNEMRVARPNGSIAAYVTASQPDVKWVGDQLFYFHDGEIRAWLAGVTWTVANVLPDLAPSYPRDDVYFSADAQRFTMTRYFGDGHAERWLGVTATGVMQPLPGDGTVFTEWSPVGHTLLIRSTTTASLLGEDGLLRTRALSALAGPVHGWTAQGQLFFGRMSPTVELAFDSFRLFDDAAIVTTLPNLLGARTFSPDGRAFAGIRRDGLYAGRLEVYRCGAPASRADTAARARASSVASDGHRFLRPVSGAITQYLQGSHTGIDVAAPFGSIIVAPDDGVVSAVGWVPVGGRRVCVTHGDGVEDCGYHTSVPLVSIGEHVVRGQPIALIGMTGVTTGPHEHWELTLNGRFIDPLSY